MIQIRTLCLAVALGFGAGLIAEPTIVEAAPKAQPRKAKAKAKPATQQAQPAAQPTAPAAPRERVLGGGPSNY